MRTIRLFAWMIGTALLIAPTSSAPPDETIRLTASEPSSVTMEMVLPAFQFQEIFWRGRKFREIRVAGWGSTEDAGGPRLPVTGSLVEVPARGNVRLTILAADFSTIRGYEPPLVERLALDDPDDPAAAGEETLSAPPNAFIPGPLARASETLRLRGIPVVRILFSPFQWNPWTHELRVYDRVTVRLDFDEALPSEKAPPPVADEFSSLARASILNRAARPAASVSRSASSRLPGWVGRERLRLEIGESGIYRLDAADLEAAGISPAGLRPVLFRLYRQDQEVSFAFHGRTGAAWEPGDYLEFYGRKIDSPFTETNVYWLVWDEGPGERMAQRSVPPAGSGTRTTTFKDKIRIEENLLPWFQTPGAPSAEHWFWIRLQAPAGITVPFTLPDDTAAGEAMARIRVTLQGRSTAGPHPNHRTRLSLDGALLSDEEWDGTEVFRQEAEVAQARLDKGVHALRIEAVQAGSVDVTLLDAIEIDFRRGLNALGNEILFSPETAGFHSFEIGGFTDPEVLVYDVSDPDHPSRLSDFAVASAPGGYIVRFGASTSDGARFYLAAAGKVRRVGKIERVARAALSRGTNRADVIVIAPRELKAAAAPLLAAQAARGARSFFAPIEDVFDEFAYGLPDPAAIRDFLKTAYETWARPAPLHVLLMGDATYDYKDYLRKGKAGQVPAHFSWTNLNGLVADDNWYACVDGDDDLPDLFIGRVPGGSLSEAAAMARKLAGFDVRRAPPPPRVLLVADDGDPQFERINDLIVPMLPPGFAAQKIYLSAYPNAQQASSDLLAAVNAGLFLVNFAGHGNVTLWTGELVFDNAKVAALANADAPALFCAYTCNCGFFADSPGYCLAETLLRAPDRGAFACFAATSSGFAWQHEIMSGATMRHLFQVRPASLGAAFTQAKLEAFKQGASTDSLRTFTLFGDPSLKLELP